MIPSHYIYIFRFSLHCFLFLIEPKYTCFWASLMTQMVKNLPAMQETQVQSLGWEVPWKGMAPTPVFLPGKFHGGTWRRATVHGAAKTWTRLTN